MALDAGRGRSAVAVRSSLAAVTLGVTTLVAAVTFGAGLSHLLATPALYGQSWDVGLTTYDDLLPTRGVPILTADRHVAGVAVGRLQVGFDLDGRRVDGLAVDTVDGRLGPTILEGRRPRGGNEIALGTLDPARVGVAGRRRRAVGTGRVPPGPGADAHRRSRRVPAVRRARSPR